MLETIGVTKENRNTMFRIIAALDKEVDEAETKNPARVIVYNDCIIISSRYDKDTEKGNTRHIIIKGEPERIDEYLKL